jgi:uncharacterized protein
MSKLCVDWETEAQRAQAEGIRLVILRLGLVFGPASALPSLVLPYRFGLGGKLGSGQQVMSWIHREDVMRLIAHALRTHDMQGVYNAVSPEAVQQAAFAEAVGSVLHRPAWFSIPAAPIRFLAGEMGQLFLDGQRVIPARLMTAGFQFRYPTLLSALVDLL